MISWPNDLTNPNLAIVAHDAGGAEILSSLVRRNSLTPLYVLDGPAQKIFERKLYKVTLASFDAALKQADVILSGTSWQSDLEYHAIKQAKAMGKKTIAFIDHWVNYKERFVRNFEPCLHDEIWVGDDDAERLANSIFENQTIRLIENPYFLDLKDEMAILLQSVAPPASDSFLYVCEPIKEHAKLKYGNERHWGYTEDDALRYFLKNIHTFFTQIDSICIRLHPSEPQGKYDAIVSAFDLPVTYGGKETLLQEIVKHNTIVGCETMAMVVGLLAKKRVVSSIPPGGHPCRLPQKEIEMLREKVIIK